MTPFAAASPDTKREFHPGNLSYSPSQRHGRCDIAAAYAICYHNELNNPTEMDGLSDEDEDAETGNHDRNQALAMSFIQSPFIQSICPSVLVDFFKETPEEIVRCLESQGGSAFDPPEDSDFIREASRFQVIEKNRVRNFIQVIELYLKISKGDD